MDTTIASLARTATAQRLLIVAAALAYLVAVISGAAPAFGATALCAAALAVLGVALFAFVGARLPGREAARLGGRAQHALQRYRRLALVTLALVYLTLVAGTLVANSGALWACLALPFCAAGDVGDLQHNLALIALGHRVFAGIAALSVWLLAYAGWRQGAVRSVHRAAFWALTFMAVQVVVGMIQVALALNGAIMSLYAIRGAHLAMGVAAWAALIVQVALVMYLPPQSFQAYKAADRAQPVARSTQPSKLKDYISLTKPGVITLLILTTIVGMYITPAGVPGLALVAWTCLGGWLMASGAHAVNCWADRDIDINMGRTSRRPIPSGRIPAWHALVLGIALGALAFAILAVFVNLVAALLSLAGYLYYVIIYTRWLKRSTAQNIVIGGGAGAFPPLVGWAAVTGGLSLPSLLLFAIIFYWTPPHFWALALIRAKDYARAGVPMLPVVAGEAETHRQIVVYTLIMLVVSLLPTPLGMFGLPYMLMALAFGAIFLRYALLLRRDGTIPAAWALYKYSLLYLALLFVAMVVDRLVFA